MTRPSLCCEEIDHAAALNAAEAACARNRRGLTPLRRTVLKLLLQTDRPLRAYSLLDRVKAQALVKPPTVYRTLDYLIKAGLVHKVESLDSFAACRHVSHAHVPIFLICDQCDAIRELVSDTTSPSLSLEAKAVGFRAHTTVLEVRGQCADCQGEATNPSDTATV